MIILKNQHEPFVIGNSVNYHGVIDTLTTASERASHRVIIAIKIEVFFRVPASETKFRKNRLSV